MENYLFRATMPYYVFIKDGKIVVKNRFYNLLFEGYFKTPLTTKVYNLIKDEIACKPDERFTTNSCEFWLYVDSSSPLGESNSGINHTLLNNYYTRLTSLLKLCDGLSFSNNNPLIGSVDHIVLVEQIHEKDAQIKEKDAQIKELLAIVNNLSKSC